MTNSLWFDTRGGLGQMVEECVEISMTMTTTCPQSLEIHSSSYLWGQIVDQVQSELILTNNNLTTATLPSKTSYRIVREINHERVLRCSTTETLIVRHSLTYMNFESKSANQGDPCCVLWI